MTLAEVMKELKALGTAQNVKVYRRHGAGDDVFGVSSASLGVLHKKIRTDHALADALWKTGNWDARTLATLIANPQEFTTKSADSWVREIRSRALAGLLAAPIARSRVAHEKLEVWTASDEEHVRQCGYNVLGAMLRCDPASISDGECRGWIGRIEKEVHGSPNQARHAMNMALIAIGIYKPSLRDEAIRAGRRIGPVEVDHGDTGCTTPAIEPYILKAAARAKGPKTGRRKAAKAPAATAASKPRRR